MDRVDKVSDPDSWRDIGRKGAGRAGFARAKRGTAVSMMQAVCTLPRKRSMRPEQQRERDRDNPDQAKVTVEVQGTIRKLTPAPKSACPFSLICAIS